jgi:hypothetical protein
LSFDIHKWSQETFWGAAIIGIALVLLGDAANVIRPYMALCWFTMLVAGVGIFMLFRQFDPEKLHPTIAVPPPIGILDPADDPDPGGAGSGGAFSDPDEIGVFLGAHCMAFTPNDRIQVVSIGGNDLLIIRREAAGISIDAKCFGVDGKIIAEIRNNRFFINSNNSFRSEQPDSHTLVVYDQQDQVAIDVRYMNKRWLRVRGVFRAPNHDPVRIDDRGIDCGKDGLVTNIAFEIPRGASAVIVGGK